MNGVYKQISTAILSGETELALGTIKVELILPCLTSLIKGHSISVPVFAW